MSVTRPELHVQLSENLNGDPEEDVDVLVLNRNFETIARSSTTSGVIAPTLLDEGQARLLAQPNMRYRVSILTWDNQASTLARFSSRCTPELSSLAPDLIFLVSCDKQTGVREFRVLRSNGKLALKGGSNPDDFDHVAKGQPEPPDLCCEDRAVHHSPGRQAIDFLRRICPPRNWKSIERTMASGYWACASVLRRRVAMGTPWRRTARSSPFWPAARSRSIP